MCLINISKNIFSSFTLFLKYGNFVETEDSTTLFFKYGKVGWNWKFNKPSSLNMGNFVEIEDSTKFVLIDFDISNQFDDR